MKIDYYLEEKANLRAQNRLLKFAIIAIGLAVLIQGCFTYIALNYQRVVLVPPGLSEKVWVKGNEASDHYLRQMGRYLALLLLHFTPSSAEEQFSELLSYVAPDAYPQVKAELEGVLEKVKALTITSIFHVQEISLEPKEQVLEVKGFLTQYAGQAKSIEQTNVVRLKYSINQGRLLIHEIEQKELRGS